MPRGPRAMAIQLSEERRSALEAMTRSGSLPSPLVRRVRVVLLAPEGKTNVEIGMTVGLSRPMVGMWRQRCAGQRLMGLYDERRSGGPRTIDDDRIVALIRKTIESKPEGRTHWSCRAIAGETAEPVNENETLSRRSLVSNTGDFLPYA